MFSEAKKEDPKVGLMEQQGVNGSVGGNIPYDEYSFKCVGLHNILNQDGSVKSCYAVFDDAQGGCSTLRLDYSTKTEFVIGKSYFIRIYENITEPIDLWT